MLASELFAISHNRECKGQYECHWCGARCKDFWTHDDPPPVPFVRTNTTAKRPGNPWICVGCWLYRRPSITAYYLDDAQPQFLDRVNLVKHSWLLTATDTKIIRPSSTTDLYKFLLKPSLRFALALVDEGIDNFIQLTIANNYDVIETGSRLSYSINGVPFSYSIYELEQAMVSGPEGKEAGVRMLLNRLGPPSASVKALLRTADGSTEKKRRGRPNQHMEDGKVTKQVVSASGRH